MPKSEPSKILKELDRLEHLRDSACRPPCGENRVAPASQAIASESASPNQTECDDDAGGHRRFERFVIRGDAELLSMDRALLSQSSVAILLRDISRGGLGFISSQKLTIGSTWHVTFLLHGHAAVQQAIVVRHCQNVGPGTFLVGAQFCATSGLMAMLGVPPQALRDPTSDDEPAARTPAQLDDDPGGDFLSPHEL